MKLVIVESPAKAKTIGRFLGNEYKVVASFGHIRDLPSSADEVPKAIKDKPWARMAVDVDNDFTPFYVVPKDNKKQVQELRALMKDADEVVLATDEDREGESISWHLLETLKPKVPVKRIAFHEITRAAIDHAIAHPRDVNEQLVRAQESRRILDRLYGYSLSPVLWRKVRSKLSAGRVQSVAVRLVVEREEARRAFHRATYWDIEATLAGGDTQFGVTLVALGGKRLAGGKDFDSSTGNLKKEAEPDVVWLQEDAAKRVAGELGEHTPWHVSSVEQKKTKQRPQPPFITSTLQQAASSLLGMSPARTMRVAQRLYEGVDLGGGDREGLITYMRTDSVVLSNKAMGEAGQVITKLFGEEYYKGPRSYTTKSKMAQEAHEAIRPTHLDRQPETVAPFIDSDGLRLYRLIWNRTVASQMTDAELLKTTVAFEAATNDGPAVLRTTGSVVTFPGFLKVSDTQTKDTLLPPIEQGMQVGPGEQLVIESLQPTRHETQPPARYTEASLVKRLEEEGIGRPSTYAPTISTIQQRGYVVNVSKGGALAPTYTGIAVTDLLRAHFSEYVDLNFTARMENALDNIAEGHENSKDFLEAFYRGNGRFGHGLVKQIDDELPNIEFPALLLGNDPENGEPLYVRLGRNVPYLQRADGGEGNTAPLPADLYYEDLTAEKAHDLIEQNAQGSDELGEDPETGEKVYALLGPYGPYVQLGEAEKGKPKPKRASLPKGMALEDVDLPLALKLLSLPRELGKHPDQDEPVLAGVGRYGPYVKCDKEFRSLEDSDDVYTVGLDRALELLAQPKQRRASKKVLRELGKHPHSEAPVTLYEGRYGPYVSDGDKNASLPKDMSPDDCDLGKAVELLAKAPEKKKRAPRKRKASPKKKSSS
ncbi:MAG: type I DNA topoisomerase [Candidatus Hydrogenedentota bacterium]